MYNYVNLTLDNTILGINACLIKVKSLLFILMVQIEFIKYYNMLGNYTFKNKTLTKLTANFGNLILINFTLNDLLNQGNLTLKNFTVNKRINNHNNLTIDDNTIFTENTFINNDCNGLININTSDRITVYMISLNGNYTFKNITFNHEIINNRTLTLI